MTRRTMILTGILAATVALAGEYELSWKGPERNCLVTVELAGEHLAALGGHPEWLRLFDRNGNVVPWARRQMTAIQYGERRVEMPLQLDEARHGDNDQLDILCHVPPEALLPETARFSFHTRMKDFEQQVVIHGVDDDGQERLLQADGFIFESSANLDLRNVDVSFAPQGCRRFRLELCSASLERRAAVRQMSREWDSSGAARLSERQNVMEQAFKIDRLELWGLCHDAVGEQPLWGEHPAKILSQKTESGVTTLLLAPVVYPVSGVRLFCDEENYCRSVKIYNILNNNELQIFAGTARRFALGILKDESLLTFNAVNAGRLRVEIENQDSPPLHLTAMDTRHPMYSLRFVGNADMMPCRLTAEPNGHDPRYDTAALLAFGDHPDAAVTIRPERLIGAPLEADPAATERRGGLPRTALLAAVALAVAAMGAALYSILKKA